MPPQLAYEFYRDVSFIGVDAHMPPREADAITASSLFARRLPMVLLLMPTICHDICRFFQNVAYHYYWVFSYAMTRVICYDTRPALRCVDEYIAE